MNDEPEYSTGVYKCKGHLEDAKINIHLEQVVPWFILDGEQDKSIHGQPKHFSRTISWQERIPSRKEAKGKEDSEPPVIFTYTSGDAELTNQLEKANRYLGSQCDSSLSKLMRRQIIKSLPPETLNRHGDPEVPTLIQSMYILADLNVLLNSAEEEMSTEYILAILKYNPETHELVTYPDLNGERSIGNPGYFLKPIGATRVQYVYWISIDQENVNKLDRFQVPRQVEPVHDVIFDTTKKGMLDIYFICTIISCHMFNHGNIFINYYFSVPEGWLVDSNTSLSGNTHSCESRSSKVVFQHLIEAKLSLKYNILDEVGNHDQAIHWPELLIRVLAQDKWGRMSVEGYGVVNLPVTPGICQIQVNTFRPALNRVNALRKYFIGTAPQINDLTSTNYTQTPKDKVIGLFGLETTTSGTVELQIQSIHQSHLGPSKNNLLLDRISSQNLISSVNTVLNLFKDAHNKLHSVLQE